MLKLRPHYRRFAKVSTRWAQNESKGSTANCKCNTHPQMPLELPPVQSHWLQELLLGQKEPHRYCHLYRRAAAVVVGRIHPTAADFADQTLQNQTWLMPGDVSKESYGRWHNVCFQPQIYLQLYVSIRSGDGWKSTTLVVWLSMGGFGSRLGGETESQFVVYYILPFVKKLNNKRENYWFFFSRQNVVKTVAKRAITTPSQPNFPPLFCTDALRNTEAPPTTATSDTSDTVGGFLASRGYTDAPSSMGYTITTGHYLLYTSIRLVKSALFHSAAVG